MHQKNSHLPASSAPLPPIFDTLDMDQMHAQIWAAIDAYAQKHGLSTSGLAKRAGLDPTAFNKSKRYTATRPRWPSTESIMKILQATGGEMNDLVELLSATPKQTSSDLLLPAAQLSDQETLAAITAGNDPKALGEFEAQFFPGIQDTSAFMVEIDTADYDPIYRHGDLILVSPSSETRKSDRVIYGKPGARAQIGEAVRRLQNGFRIKALSPDRTETIHEFNGSGWMYRIVAASQ